MCGRTKTELFENADVTLPVPVHNDYTRETSRVSANFLWKRKRRKPYEKLGTVTARFLLKCKTYHYSWPDWGLELARSQASPVGISGK